MSLGDHGSVVDGDVCGLDEGAVHEWVGAAAAPARVFSLGALRMLVSGVVVKTVEAPCNRRSESRWAAFNTLLTFA